MPTTTAFTDPSATGCAALLGIATPIAGIALPGRGTDLTLAIVSVQRGTLIADTAPGALVRGAGSNLVWISGSIDQINAKLATLTYLGGTPGTDPLTVTSVGPTGQITTALHTAIDVLPSIDPAASGNDVITIEHGTLTLDTRVVDGPSIALIQPGTDPSAPTAILINTTLGAHSAMSMVNAGLGGAAPRLAVAGRVELDGTTRIAGSSATVSLAQGAALSNEGSMSITAGAALFTGTGTLINDGSISIDGSAASVRIDSAVGGAGSILLGGGASLSLGASVAATETVLLGSGANTLHLAAPSAFAGVIAGFDRADTIVLDGTAATNAIYSAQADAQTGTLSLFNGAHLIGNLRFSAPETGTVFQLGTDAAGNTMIQASPVLPTAASANPDVFRFFDRTNGTQFLTQSTAERDATIASRPDLRFEGTDFKAVAPGAADTNAVNVYRFFDTSNGTHFLTSSLTERDTLLSSRPDLVFEPGGTLVEHATAQAGDVAVYRFFDQHSGAHFFTADAGERASIIATRPDMTAEGIAFYAPTT